MCALDKITAKHVHGGLKVITDIILFILIHALVLNFGHYLRNIFDCISKHVVTTTIAVISFSDRLDDRYTVLE